MLIKKESKDQTEELQLRLNHEMFKNDFTIERFCKRLGIPSYHVTEIMGRAAVIIYLKICDHLNLDPFEVTPLDTLKENRLEGILENRLLSYYVNLNQEGRKKAFAMLVELTKDRRYMRV